MVEETDKNNEMVGDKQVDTTELAKSIAIPPANNKKDAISALVKSIGPQIATALPKQIGKDRFVRVILTTLRKNPKLMECTKESLFGALLTSAQFGLEPGPLGQCYLIPYGKDVEFQLGYKGIIDLMRRSGEIESMDAEIVYTNDHFEYEKGLSHKLVHKPCLDGDRGEMRAAWFMAKFKNGGSYFRVMSKDQILKSKKASKSSSGSNSPWVKWEEEMWLKTVIKKAEKLMPLSIETQEMLTVDNVIRRTTDGDLKQTQVDDESTMDFELG